MPQPTPRTIPDVGVGARRAVQVSLLLLGITMVLLLVGPQWGVFCIVAGPATIAAMITALVRLRGLPGLAALRVMLGVGMGVAVIALLYGLGLILFRGPVADLRECQSRAITEQAQRACMAEYEAAYVELLENLGRTQG